MRITIVIVSYNTAHVLRETISALRQMSGKFKLRCVVIDNASSDESVQVIKGEALHDVLIENPVNVGFGRAINQAIPFLDGRYVLLLNPDAFVSSDSLEKTIAYMETHPTCGILGVKLLGPDGSLQPSCRYFPTPWNLFLHRTGLKRFFPNARLVDDLAWNHASVRQCDWVPGCFYLVRKELVEQIGLFDPRYFLYYEEVDHCLAAKRAGWDVVFYPGTTVLHTGGESARSEGEVTSVGRQIEAIQMESELLYFRKNHGILAVWSDVLLGTLADVAIMIKRLITRNTGGVRAQAKHAALLWSLFVRTQWGMRPTR